MNTAIESSLKKLPHGPGVYRYYDSRGVLLYVGKAIDLFRRVNSYFQKQTENVKIRQLVEQIAQIEIIQTQSEFDAILLEAKLIHEHQPKYNAIAKDDKSPLYVCISKKELLPHIVIARKASLDNSSFSAEHSVCFGPFPSGQFVRKLLQTIRHIVPFCTQKQRSGKPCFYTHLGLCDPCPSYITRLEQDEEKHTLTKNYKRNIKRIIQILSGESAAVVEELRHGMEVLAAQERYEEAERLRKQIQHLIRLQSRRFDPLLTGIDEDIVGNSRLDDLQALREVLRPWYPDMAVPRRIECIDISNLGGSLATGSLVVLIDGKADHSSYRRFRIKRVMGSNDFAMIAEVVTRRLGHTEWPYPNLLVIDGGPGQVKSALAASHIASVTLPIIGLAKRFEYIIVPTQGKTSTIRLPLTHPAVRVLQSVRDEAHRFALSYHHILRRNLLSLK